MSSGIEEMKDELNAGECRIFAMHCENFAIPAKFHYAQFFAMIAKFRYHSENSLS